MKFEHKHKIFEEVLDLASRKINGSNPAILLTGEAGTGKSVIVEQIANEFKLPFSYIAGSGQTSESKLLGYVDAKGDRVETLFTKAYRDGGVFCLEEMDAIPSSVLVSVNSAIASNTGSFAGKMVEKHKDFYMFATTNTYKGVTEVYSGRNKLDDSTLERYYKIEVDIDIELEAKILDNDDFTMVQYFREILSKYNIRVSTRQALMFLGLKGLDLKKALAMTLFRNNETSLEMLIDEFRDSQETQEKIPKYTKEEYEKILLGEKYEK